MAKVTYVDANDNRTEVQMEPGETVMGLAINNLVDGILGECGGAMACATCHCYLDEKYAGNFAPIGEMESEMLEMAVERKPTSRLSCQLELTDNMDDIEIQLPSEQA